VQDGAPALPQHAHVVIIGCGLAGMAAAIGLLRAGEPDVVVLERAAEIGGTWRDNTYPGCACDVPSHLYSLSYAPRPDWSRSFATQDEIQSHLISTSTRFGVRKLVRFGAELQQARWDADGLRWLLTTTLGELSADVLVSATGPLSEPSVPTIAGLELFRGTAFHSARWDHGRDLAGRVAVVGTGASAIQLVPHVQRTAAHLTVFQRTPPWVLPRRDRRIFEAEKVLFRKVPALQRLVRAGIYWGRESWVLGFTGRVPFLALVERRGRALLARTITDAALRQALTPTFSLGCKRVLQSNDYYPALAQDNVTVSTDRVVEVRPHAVVTVDARGTLTEHPTDTLIFCTGFRVTDPPVAHRVTGTDGRTLAQHWAEQGMQAYLGLGVTGFPNYFQLVGPNTGLGHSSIIIMIEAQVKYLIDLLAQMRLHDVAAVEPRSDVQQAYNEKLQRAMARTVWSTGGCSSWYLDRHGRNTTLWPGFTFAFRRRLTRAVLTDYLPHERSAL